MGWWNDTVASGSVKGSALAADFLSGEVVPKGLDRKARFVGVVVLVVLVLVVVLWGCW